MSLENQLHNPGDAKKEQRITHLKNRVNQLKQKYPNEDTITRKTIETVIEKNTEKIHEAFITDNAKKLEIGENNTNQSRPDFSDLLDL